MEESQTVKKLLDVKQGNEIVRQQILNQHKPYIINVVSHICRKFVSWSDEESSIGLIAFNRAIDTYISEKGRTFLSYAYYIINRDLINYFHKNKNDNRNLSLDNILNEEASAISVVEIEKSMEYYNKKVQSNELIQEIVELEQELSKYGIQFEELEYSSPRHKDTKKTLNDMVGIFFRDKELIDELIKKKKFPAALFVKKTGCPVKTVERYRKYLITVIVVNLHPDWTYLLNYMSYK